MKPIEWNPSFSVGVKSLDEQHRRIIGMINLLISDPGATVRSETISEALTRLTAYASEHFQGEERLLEEHDYPDLARHKEEHRTYRMKIVQLCQETMDHKDSVPAELLDYLREWWAEHILGTDMKYRPFFAERGIR